MRKSTLFISAVLTTFVMAMLAGVASAYQKMSDADPIAATAPESQPETMAIANTVPAPTEAQPVNWTPEEASALAAQVLGHDDLYSVEVTDLNGESVYMVTFSSGDLVYISMDGQIRSIGKVEVETVVVNTGGKGKSGGNNNKASNSGQSHESHDDDHDDDDEHEEHDDD